MDHNDYGVGVPEACRYCDSDNIHWYESEDGSYLNVTCNTCERQYTYEFDGLDSDDLDQDESDQDEDTDRRFWGLTHHGNF